MGAHGAAGGGVTVAELRIALASLPAETVVMVGVCDGEHRSGGVFAVAEEAIPWGDGTVQVTAWAPVSRAVQS